MVILKEGNKSVNTRADNNGMKHVISYRYIPVKSITLGQDGYAFEIRRKIKTIDSRTDKCTLVYDEEVMVVLNVKEIQELYDNPERFWEVYIGDIKTAKANPDDDFIIRNEEKYRKKIWASAPHI